VSKTEVFGVALISFGAGLGITLAIPGFYETLNRIILLLVDQIILPYFLVWIIASILFVLFFGIAFLHYEEQLAMVYRILWIWGTTAFFGWFGGVVTMHDPFLGLLLWGLGFLLGLFFRWVAPPLTKFLLWREVS